MMMPETEITLSEEFASTMQQLVAEAEKTAEDEGSAEELCAGVGTVEERLASLERTMAAGFAKLAAAVPANGETPWQMERIDENLRALRNTESVNQRLFNSLHKELQEYRDNFVRDALQKPTIRDLIVLFDDLTSLAAQMRSAAKGRPGRVTQWSANLENAIHSMMETLHRLEVNEIEPQEMVDRTFHKVMSYEAAERAEDDGRIVRRLKCGFVWREQILRPEEVVALRFG